MCKGGSSLLLAFVYPDDVYFLDVRGHDVFEDPVQVKELLRIVLGNWRMLLEPFILSGVSDPSPSFEVAFKMALSGAVCLFDVDGVVLSIGQTMFDAQSYNGSATSIEVVRIVNNIFNRVCRLVDWIAENSEKVASSIQKKTGVMPAKIDLRVGQIGETVYLTDRGNYFFALEQDGVMTWLPPELISDNQIPIPP